MQAFEVVFVFHCRRCLRGVLANFSHSKLNISSHNNNSSTNDIIFVAFNLIIICDGAHKHTPKHIHLSLTHSLVCVGFVIFSLHKFIDWFFIEDSFLNKKSAVVGLLGSFELNETGMLVFVCAFHVHVCVHGFFPSNFSHIFFFRLKSLSIWGVGLGFFCYYFSS